MNADDLARLAVAKRAFQATQPNAREIQIGVRRARLSLERRRPRRNWFSKGLVMVVLAAGGLAYAKPQALAEVVAHVMPAPATDYREAATSGARRESQPDLPTRAGRAPSAAAALGDARAAGHESHGDARPDAREAASGAEQVDARHGASPALGLEAAHAASAPTSASRPKSAADAVSGEQLSGSGQAKRTASLEPAERAASLEVDGSAASKPAAAPAQALTEWGRVGQALARGDEQKALSALVDLSESDDPRTRDKADLGRAQLLMAHGNSEKACAIARSLTHRRAGGRIERQAQVLLKSCR